MFAYKPLLIWQTKVSLPVHVIRREQTMKVQRVMDEAHGSGNSASAAVPVISSEAEQPRILLAFLLVGLFCEIIDSQKLAACPHAEHTACVCSVASAAAPHMNL